MRIVFKLIAWLAVVAVMALFYQNSRSVHLNDHELVSATLESVKEQDSLISVRLLESRHDLTLTYDPLNRAVASIQRSLSYLERGTVAEYRRSQAEFDASFKEYKELFVHRKKLIEKYAEKRAELRKRLKDQDLSMEEKLEVQEAFAKLPRVAQSPPDKINVVERKASFPFGGGAFSFVYLVKIASIRRLP